jgi:hypothetical protein
MINSLCHLPIGTIVSIALIPVSNGVFTDFLVITQGAIFSTGKKCFASIFQSPSIGFPKASKTLHKYSSPTHTLRTLQRAFTVLPCPNHSVFPRTNIPIVSGERSKTNHLVQFSNSTISENIASSNPITVATPSFNSKISHFFENSSLMLFSLMSFSIFLRISDTISIINNDNKINYFNYIGI